MRCFFLRLSNTLKQPDSLHFITSGLHNLLKYFIKGNDGKQSDHPCKKPCCPLR